MIDTVSNGVGWIVRVAAHPATAVAASQANTQQADFGAVLGSETSQKTQSSRAAETADESATTSADTLASVLASANATAAAATADSASTASAAIAVTPAASDTTSTSTTKPGVMALVQAMMNGTFQTSYVTDPAKLTQQTTYGTDMMPADYYASDATANQMAQLLGGKVVHLQPFHAGMYVEPTANFIELPNGQTFNAADVAYYSRYGDLSQNQMLACVTQTINQGAAWTSYNQSGGKGTMPEFALGYVGPPISGMDYPAGTIGADGNVINPALQGVAT